MFLNSNNITILFLLLCSLSANSQTPGHAENAGSTNNANCYVSNSYDGFNLEGTNIRRIYDCENTPEYLYYAKSENARFWYKRPKAIVFPKTKEEIATTLKLAAAAGLRVCPRSGGHSYEGYSSCNGGVLVDLQNIKGITLTDNNKYVRVNTGEILGNVFFTLEKVNKTLPQGSCHGVGVGGHALGGGYGVISRKYGILSDRIRALTVVLANGSIVTANAQSYSELFWGLRGGGGGNFGIVVEFVFETIPLPPKVLVWLQNWDLKTYAKTVMKAYFDKLKPLQLNSNINARLFLRQDNVQLWGMSINTEKSKIVSMLKDIFGKIPGNAESWDSVVKESTYAEIAVDFIPGENLTQRESFDPTKNKKLSSAVLDSTVTNIVIEKLVDNFYVKNRGGYHMLQIDPFGGYFNQVQKTSQTAFPYYGNYYMVQMITAFTNLHSNSSEVAWLENLKTSIKPYLVGLYINYLDIDDNNITKYYGNNMNRLMDLKTKYDPNSLFRFPQRIPNQNATPSKTMTTFTALPTTTTTSSSSLLTTTTTSSSSTSSLSSSHSPSSLAIILALLTNINNINFLLW